MLEINKYNQEMFDFSFLSSICSYCVLKISDFSSICCLCIALTETHPFVDLGQVHWKSLQTKYGHVARDRLKLSVWVDAHLRLTKLLLLQHFTNKTCRFYENRARFNATTLLTAQSSAKRRHTRVFVYKTYMHVNLINLRILYSRIYLLSIVIFKVVVF
jgi:hypothetical protein